MIDIESKKENLKSLGIHDLRNLGRLWGIHSPTIMKKEDLIDEIIKLMSGEKINTARSKMGRPAKSLFNPRYEDNLLPKEILEQAKVVNPEVALPETVLMLSAPDAEEYVSMLANKEGYLTQQKSNYFITTEHNEVIQIPNGLVNQNKLCLGDYIEVITTPSQIKNLSVAKDLVSINHESPTDCHRPSCAFQDIILDNQYDVIENIKEGSKTHFALQKNEDYFGEHLKTFKAFKEKGYEIVMVAVGLPVDGPLRIKSKINATLFASLYENEPMHSVNQVTTAINHAMMLARIGKKVLVVVVDFENICAELDLYFVSQGETRDKFTYSTLKLIRRLTGLNRRLINGGSVTLITLSKELSHL